jgi:hypothetical protein
VDPESESLVQRKRRRSQRFRLASLGHRETLGQR